MVEPEHQKSSRPLVIERPDLQTVSQRWGYRSITLMAWIIWFYLFMPVLSFFAWVVGLSLIYRLMLQDLSVAELWHIVSTYGLGVAFLAGCYLLWAFYSYIRFRGPDRRPHVESAKVDKLAQQHMLDEDTVALWQRQTRIIVSGETLKDMFEPEKRNANT